jgi:hypothetical protein
MKSVKSEYRPVVCATFLWAGWSAFMAAVLGLLFLVLGPVVLVGCPWSRASIGPIA